MRSRSPTGPSAAPSTAWASVGSGPVMSWPSAPRRGGSQRGLKRGLDRNAPHHPADARRDDHHGDAPAVLALRPHRRAGPCADHGQPGEADPPRGDQRQERRRGAADHRGMGQRDASGVPHDDPVSLEGMEPVLFEDRASQHKSPSSLGWRRSWGSKSGYCPGRPRN